jgi:hypothetical protein
MSSRPSFSKANEEFDQAWQEPHHTRIELEAIDVNDQLQQDYFTSGPFRLMKLLLWEA